jgi:hypothetical protein
MKNPSTSIRMKTKPLAFLLGVALLTSVISESYAQTPTPSPTPSAKRGKKAPPAPPNRIPYSG